MHHAMIHDFQVVILLKLWMDGTTIIVLNSSFQSHDGYCN
jgi:hypothetical protein